MPTANADCVFCKIVRREVPADVVEETERSVAFRDLNPQAPTHVLVIPRRHSATLPELAVDDPASAADVLALARQVAASAGHEEGYRVVLNNGPAAQQTVFHAHAHVLGGRPFSWPPG
jgi:histidine triad (HIT) family protein